MKHQYKDDEKKNIDGIIRYLSSGIIRGIGPSIAQEIVKLFGSKTIDIIENDIEKLKFVKGIGSAKLKIIQESWQKNKKFHDIILFLQEYDISIRYTIKIWQHFKEKSIEIIKNNPYVLFNEIKGIGFLKADKIAMKSGIDINSSLRAKSGINYIMQKVIADGSCCEYISVLIKKCVEELNIDINIVIENLLSLLKEEKMVAVDRLNFNKIHYSDLFNLIKQNTNITTDNNRNLNNSINNDNNFNSIVYRNHQLDPFIFNPAYYYIERFVAQKLILIKKNPSCITSIINTNKKIKWLEDNHNIKLTDNQKNGITAAINNKCSVITGGPGTGKTTMVYSLLLILRNYFPELKIKLVAPTGRAAKRLSDSTKTEAYTIHRLLEFDPIKKAFRYDENNCLRCDIMIIDEGSMIDVKMMYYLLKALQLTIHLIIIGDIDQLPSVGCGNILKDIIKSGIFPIVYLNQIFRQSNQSKIIYSAYCINNGKNPLIPPINKNNIQDCIFVDVNKSENPINKLISLIQNEIPIIYNKLISNNAYYNKEVNLKSNLKYNLQIISPMQKGLLGVRNLNAVMQNLFINKSPSQFIECFGSKYYIDDKVMQVENNYNKNVFNGDIGYIKFINYIKKELNILFDDREVLYRFSELEQIVHAYAITIHKSQGSEYPIVIIPIVTQHFMMLNRRIFYTALTRAKNLAIFIGQRKALNIAIFNRNEPQRNTILGKLLEITDNN
ncbi:SF1B family DNA helicase RecD2 [Lyticum sinuosum]|uniref:ATP-dependent RecD-like DNA helicase n=1 Tax=Lyticum sinuosum TaxID=1332059 RepID=A0AAE4VJL9_9RICK|nr:ATP-dependent RecD-like DNA helicase [Lyticum sinuosum]MDZ5761022.1 ATP-dependent RecD-like DNA helicase [Lyticum sinuosum]